MFNTPLEWIERAVLFPGWVLSVTPGAEPGLRLGIPQVMHSSSMCVGSGFE